MISGLSKTITAQVNPNTNQMEAGFFPINPDNAWRIASAFQLDHSFDMIEVHPRSTEAGDYAYFKWADDKASYKIRPTWFGGHPPYRLTLVQSPASAYLGASGKAQTYTRTLDVATGRYKHARPDDFGIITWQPTSGDMGSSHTFRLRVEDQDNRILNITWTVNCSTGVILYADSSSGSDANAGTFELPKQTLAAIFALSNSNQYVARLKDGTYPLNQSMAANKLKSIIGIGDNVVLDTTTGGCSGLMTDVSIINCEVNGSPMVSGHFKPINATSRFFRFTLDKLRFKNIVPTSFGDNSSCVFTTGLGTPATVFSEYFSMIDCTVDGSVKSQMLCTYSVKYCVVEHPYAVINIPLVPYGAKFIHLKDQTSFVSCRFADVAGLSDNILISFANQYPENCDTQELLFSKMDYTDNSQFSPLGWNGQGTTSPYKGTNQYAQRCSIRAGTRKAFITSSLGVGGEKVNVAGFLWSSTDVFATDSNGWQAFGATNVQISDAQWDASINMVDAVKSANLGYRGAEIASTLVT